MAERQSHVEGPDVTAAFDQLLKPASMQPLPLREWAPSGEALRVAGNNGPHRRPGILVAIADVTAAAMGAVWASLGVDTSAKPTVAAATNISPICWALSLYLVGRYRTDRSAVVRHVFYAAVLMLAGLSTFLYFSGQDASSGGRLVVIGLPVAVAGSIVVKMVAREPARYGVLIGEANVCSQIIEELATAYRSTSHNLRIRHVVVTSGEFADLQGMWPGISWLTGDHSLSKAIGSPEVQFVATAPGTRPETVQIVSEELSGTNMDLIEFSSLFRVSPRRTQVRNVIGRNYLVISNRRLVASGVVKRAFDAFGASVTLLISAPVMAVFALLIKLQDGGPIFYRQTRVGRDGQLFECLKFRSMVVHAEAQHPSMRQVHKSSQAGVLFKTEHDPRITSLGGYMRRHSIDELPQLINVIKGDMSLVGPRPAPPAEVRRYDSRVRRRLQVRPGLTGLWQISGRSDLSWDDTVRLDLYYVDNWSLRQDLVILLRTVQMILRSPGMY